jgi:hypothetical protein
VGLYYKQEKEIEVIRIIARTTVVDIGFPVMYSTGVSLSNTDHYKEIYSHVHFVESMDRESDTALSTALSVALAYQFAGVPYVIEDMTSSKKAECP